MLCYGKGLFTGLEVIYMTPKEILCQWVDAFNNADVETISELYDDNAINHQVANEPVIGKEAIKKMFEQDFSFPEITHHNRQDDSVAVEFSAHVVCGGSRDRL